MGNAIRTSRRQVRSHAAYWWPPALPTASGGLTYVALGDSAAQAVGVNDPRDGYVSLLGQRLRQVTGREVSITNLSVSGATLDTLIADQLPQLAPLPVPDFLTCAIGGNDVAAFRTRFYAGRFADAAHMLAGALPTHAVLATVPSFGHWPYERRVRAANEALREAASQRNLQVADLYSATRRLWPWRSLRILASDYFHPNEHGHRLWADAIWPTLDPTTT